MHLFVKTLRTRVYLFIGLRFIFNYVFMRACAFGCCGGQKKALDASEAGVAGGREPPDMDSES